MEVKGDCIINKPVKSKPRKDWDRYFEMMKEKKEDKLIFNEQVDLDMEDWEW